MSDRDPELDLTPEERALHERVTRAVRALPPEPPSAPFRAQMRQRFVAGAADAPAGVAARDPGAAAASAPSRTSRGFLGLRPVEVALALAGIAIVLGLGSTVFNAGPRWRVVPGSVTSGNVVVDDEPIPANDLASLDEALRPNSHIVWEGDGNLMFHSPGGAVIAILPGSEVRMPPPPPRWFARHTQGRVERGEIRVMTGPQFHGARFSIGTPQAAVEITGTTLAVICEPAVTCVCVFEGVVEVRDLKDGAAMVPAGERRTLFADGRPTEQAGMRPGERVALEAMRQRMHDVLE